MRHVQPEPVGRLRAGAIAALDVAEGGADTGCECVPRRSHQRAAHVEQEAPDGSHMRRCVTHGVHLRTSCRFWGKK